MDTSCCRKSIERCLVGRTGLIVKVKLKQLITSSYLRPIVLKLYNDHEFLRMLIGSMRFVLMVTDAFILADTYRPL